MGACPGQSGPGQFCMKTLFWFGGNKAWGSRDFVPGTHTPDISYQVRHPYGRRVHVWTSIGFANHSLVSTR